MVGIERAVAVIGEMRARAVNAFGYADVSSTLLAGRAVFFMVLVGVVTAAFAADDHIGTA